MFRPPFCPDPSCLYHYLPPAHRQWYYHRGSYPTAAFGPVLRFRCRRCGKDFSRQTFRLDYYVKRPLDYQKIKDRLIGGSGLRAIGRSCAISHHSITNRIGRLARQALAMNASLLGDPDFHPCENLAADGFESFVADQWQPNNIHLLVGSQSQCLYRFDYAHLRRKGRMTERQKRERARREQSYVRTRVSIGESFSRIVTAVEDLFGRSTSCQMQLYTDCKSEYLEPIQSSPVLSKLTAAGLFCHRQISSRLPRTVHNPLFPVNYLDRELRLRSADQVRETLQFSRSVNTCLERLAVCQLQHNFIKPYRVDDREGKWLRHAEVAGIARQRIERWLGWLFDWRAFYSLVNLSSSEELAWRRAVGNVDRFDGGYRPAYVMM